MSIQLKARQRWLVPAAIVLTLAGIFLAWTVFARVTYNTINPVAIVTGKGRQLVVTGPISATAGEKVILRVTVTQRSTGALAEGDVVLEGTGTTNQWQVLATAQGKAAFEPGPATAVGLGVSTTRGNTTDAHQWLVNLTLISE